MPLDNINSVNGYGSAQQAQEFQGEKPKSNPWKTALIGGTAVGALAGYLVLQKIGYKKGMAQCLELAKSATSNANLAEGGLEAIAKGLKNNGTKFTQDVRVGFGVVKNAIFGEAGVFAKRHTELVDKIGTQFGEVVTHSKEALRNIKKGSTLEEITEQVGKFTNKSVETVAQQPRNIPIT